MTKKQILAGLQNILEWAESRDGSPEADDRALRAIAKDARAILKAAAPEKKN